MATAGERANKQFNPLTIPPGDNFSHEGSRTGRPERTELRSGRYGASCRGWGKHRVLPLPIRTCATNVSLGHTEDTDVGTAKGRCKGVGATALRPRHLTQSP
eukprot:2457018-Pleurochrysis_carterae.AAC.4